MVALGLAKNCQTVLGERLKDMVKLACSPNINLTVRLMVSNESAWKFDAYMTREIARKYLYLPPKCGVGTRAFVHYEFIGTILVHVPIKNSLT